MTESLRAVDDLPDPPFTLQHCFDLRTRYLALAETRAQLDEEMGAIAAELAQLGEGEHLDGNIKVSYGRRFDIDTAKNNLPPAALELCYEPTPQLTAARAKQVLAPSLYALCQKRNDKPTVKVQ